MKKETEKIVIPAKYINFEQLLKDCVERYAGALITTYTLPNGDIYAVSNDAPNGDVYIQTKQPKQ